MSLIAWLNGSIENSIVDFLGLIYCQKKFENENEIDWKDGNCEICNIFDQEVLKKSKTFKSLKKTCVAFQKFVTVSVFLHNCHDAESNIDYIEHEEVTNFCKGLFWWL